MEQSTEAQGPREKEIGGGIRDAIEIQKEREDERRRIKGGD